MNRTPQWALLVVCLGGCSLALDSDELRFPGHATEALDAEPTPPNDTTTPLSDQLAPDSGPDISAASDTPEPGPDPGPPTPTIRIEGDASGCTASFHIDKGLAGLTPDCARACGGDLDGWPVRFSTDSATSSTWKVAATNGFVTAPASGKGASFETVVRFGNENCGDTGSVPEFSVVVTLTTSAGKAEETLTIAPFLDEQCDPVDCAP